MPAHCSFHPYVDFSAELSKAQFGLARLVCVCLMMNWINSWFLDNNGRILNCSMKTSITQRFNAQSNHAWWWTRDFRCVIIFIGLHSCVCVCAQFIISVRWWCLPTLATTWHRTIHRSGKQQQKHTQPPVCPHARIREQIARAIT